jgi:hypothetical protein
VNGTIDGDLFAAGQSITVNGRVRGDVRGAASSVDINGEVGRNVLAFAGTATVGGSGRVGGDFIAYTGSTSVAGEVRGDVGGTTAAYQRTGSVGGRDLVQISEPEPREEVPEPATTPAQWFLSQGRLWLSVVLVGALCPSVAVVRQHRFDHYYAPVGET